MNFKNVIGSTVHVSISHQHMHQLPICTNPYPFAYFTWVSKPYTSTTELKSKFSSIVILKIRNFVWRINLNCLLHYTTRFYFWNYILWSIQICLWLEKRWNSIFSRFLFWFIGYQSCTYHHYLYEVYFCLSLLLKKWKAN